MEKTLSQSKIILSISLAVVLRLILMPISLHGDLLYIHSMPPVIFLNGAWNLFRYFGDFGARNGYIHYPPLVGYFLAFFEYLWSLACHFFYGFIVDLPQFILANNGVTSAVFEYFEDYPLVLRLWFSFLMKFSYLIFDMLCGLLIYRIFKKEKNSVWFGIFFAWMFHPVLLYGSYIFGQHRIYSALFIWLAILLLKKGKTNGAAFAFGWILLLDNYGFILFLPFLLTISKNLKSFAQNTLIALIPFVTVFSPLYLDSHYASYAYLSPQWLFQAKESIFPTIPYSAIALKTIFAAIFIYVLFLLLNKRNELSKDQKLKLTGYVWCVILLGFYSATMTSVHYFLWILPFFLILQKEGTPWPKYLNHVLIFLLFFFNLDSRSQNLGLFLPLNPNAFSWPSLHDVMSQWMPWGKLIGLSRMTFTIICFYMIFNLINKKIKPLLGVRRKHAL